MQPNNECTDANCCKNQQYYKQNAEKRRLQAEKEEINQFVSDTLDYPDADVEEVIADAFKVAIDASDLVQDIIALAKSIGKLKAA